MKQLVVMVAAAAFFLATVSAQAAGLRPQPSVTGEAITLGDLFEGLPAEQALTVIGRAPLPGQSTTLDAGYLWRIAQANGVDWRPATGTERAVIRRETTVIDAPAIADRIAEALEGRGVGRHGAHLAVELDNRSLRLDLPGGTPPTLTIERLDVDAGGSRFVAMVSAPADSPQLRATVTGRIREHLELPVLTRRVRKGELIDAADIAWREVSAERLPVDVIDDEAVLIGMAARRTLAADTPLRDRDIQEPALVERGALVTIVLQTSAMVLTAQGKALQSGGEGSVVRVVNTQSNRIIEATVTGTNLVTVNAPAAVALN